MSMCYNVNMMKMSLNAAGIGTVNVQHLRKTINSRFTAYMQIYDQKWLSDCINTAGDKLIYLHLLHPLFYSFLSKIACLLRQICIKRTCYFVDVKDTMHRRACK